MEDRERTREQLIEELEVLRRQVGGLREQEGLYKRAEELEKESGDKFRKIFHYSNDAIFIIDPERDRILEANPMACTMLGYSHEELLLTPITAIDAPTACVCAIRF